MPPAPLPPAQPVQPVPTPVPSSSPREQKPAPRVKRVEPVGFFNRAPAAAKKPRPTAPAKPVKVTVNDADPSFGAKKPTVTIVTFSDFQ